MALDDTTGGGGGRGPCPLCGGFGLATDRISEPEARRLLPDDVPDGMKITYAHITRACDCPAGDRWRNLREGQRDD